MKIIGAYSKETYIKFEMSLKDARSLVNALNCASIDMDDSDSDFIYTNQIFYPKLKEAVADLEKIEGDENGS